MKSIVALVLFSLLLSLGITSHARTPDGKTPSEETVCDGQVGAAYGLCNSYCEAMDCDSDYPKASEKACNKVLANFQKKTDGDIPPCIDRCLDVTCPDGETCLDGECFCGEELTCASGEVCEDGECTPEDPCAELAAVAECPCNYSDFPMTEACWTQYSQPMFSPCSDDSCLTISDDNCTINTVNIGQQVGIEARRIIQVGLSCQVSFGFGIEGCPANENMTVSDLTEAQFLTCLCRIEQYADELATVPDIVIDGDGPPFSCSPCGNGVVNVLEACDDGNQNSGDGCSADCSTIEPGFICAVPGEPCMQTVCGDGNLDPGEECDDGNNIPGDGCSSVCLFEFCGNGNLDPPEQCDDGNTESGDGCSSTCKEEAICGDGNLDPGEECDDGNNIPNDGCSSTCRVEGFCGDGSLDPGEECDDGNNIPGDGCSNNCLLEAL